MSDITGQLSSHFAYQIERLYWKATVCADCGNEWREEFGQLESKIQAELNDAERAKLLRRCRSYQQLRQFTA